MQEILILAFDNTEADMLAGAHIFEDNNHKVFIRDEPLTNELDKVYNTVILDLDNKPEFIKLYTPEQLEEYLGMIATKIYILCSVNFKRLDAFKDYAETFNSWNHLVSKNFFV